MDAAYIKVTDLRPGIVISEDIFMNTNQPIIRKNSEITTEHLEILFAFDVKKVKVKDTIVVTREEAIDPEIAGPIDPDDLLEKIPMKKTDLVSLYNDAVQKYKKEFSGWQVGVRPDITKVRSIVMPLLETFLKQKNLLTTLSDLSSSKEYLYHHSISTGILSAAIGKQMGFPQGDVLQLGLAGTLADCGMAKIDKSIIEKVAFLTKEEFNEVKKHTVHSYQMVRETPLLRQDMKIAIFQHHERLDGSGYPRGEKMEKISMHSQILAVADVFHAMTSERVYRLQESTFKVIEMIREEEFGKFNIKIVHALHDLVGNLSIGTKVRLTNGEAGEVIFFHRDARLRPMVKIDKDGSVIDLTINRSIFVDSVLTED